MAKTKEKTKKQKTIVVKERADGMKDIIITKAPSKTVFGKIIISILALSMVIATVAGLIIVLIQAA